jgi:gluconokinase
MGVSGSGKSTVMAGLRERLDWSSAEADEFHSAANVAKMASGQPLNDDDRWPWLRALAAWIGAREAAGENCLVTCSALKRSYRDLLREGHASVRFVHLVAAADTLQRRIAQRRDHFMPSSLLASQLENLEPLQPDEPGLVVSSERAAARPDRRRNPGVVAVSAAVAPARVGPPHISRAGGTSCGTRCACW